MIPISAVRIGYFLTNNSQIKIRRKANMAKIISIDVSLEAVYVR